MSLLLSATAAVSATAQTPSAPATLSGWADRLARFGSGVPQEKVFLHLDNTCYFVGDTIWYAAYTRRTDKGTPSDISGVLYVELINQDGYLVERQLVEMRHGRGHGNFAIADTLYAGYYELRAYTRWQLNWGITEKEHTTYAEDWFYDKSMAKEFYRDYEKLYSRVIPVYDRPRQPGELYRDMTTRPMRRYYSSGGKEPAPQLRFYPEGGHLVAGVPSRVAFEAVTESGEALDGTLTFSNADLAQKATPTVGRGRGLLTLTAEAGRTYEAVFTTDDGRIVKATLPKAEPDGVALTLSGTYANAAPPAHPSASAPASPSASAPAPPSAPMPAPPSASMPAPPSAPPSAPISAPTPTPPLPHPLTATITPAGIAAATPLGMTVQHEGRLLHFAELNGGKPTAEPIDIRLDSLEAGVNQLTVFDATGRIWADRLFFVKDDATRHAIAVTGMKEQYAPYERTDLEVAMPATAADGTPPPTISIAVRDAATSDATYDNADIMAEMLLSSELKGFVPDPAYFFAADDDEHNRALDLLMLTQGWRRFDWHTMATPGAFALTQPAESQTPILRGQVLRYEASILQDEERTLDDTCPTPYKIEDRILSSPRDNESMSAIRMSLNASDMGLSIAERYEGAGQGEVIESIIAQTYAHEGTFPSGSYRLRSNIARSRFPAKEQPLKNDPRVHAEFTQPGSESIVGDIVAHGGTFNIPSPHFSGFCVFFLAASDTTRWKPDKPHSWIDMDETRDAEFYLRIRWPYPRFTKPFSHYQTSLLPLPETTALSARHTTDSWTTQMQTVTIRARHEGLRRLANVKPAFVVDAYTAYNEACDAGLMSGQYRGRFHFINSVARLYVGDMNTTNNYLLEPRYDGHNVSFSFTPRQVERYNRLSNLDSVAVFTDFAPRAGADPRATEENIERVAVELRQMTNEGQRVTYRDRRYVLQGFNEPDTYHSPHYTMPKGATPPRDYRRTLYWNPALQPGPDGRATVTVQTGTRPAILSVTANGLDTDGTPLTTSR